jgi:phosphoribosylformylglycinamidine synthase
MTFGNNIGCEIKIDSILSKEQLLFSETGGFVVEVSTENIEEIKSVFSNYGLDVFKIGSTGGETIQMNDVINISVNDIKEAWANGLREKL